MDTEERKVYDLHIKLCDSLRTYRRDRNAARAKINMPELRALAKIYNVQRYQNNKSRSKKALMDDLSELDAIKQFCMGRKKTAHKYRIPSQAPLPEVPFPDIDLDALGPFEPIGGPAPAPVDGEIPLEWLLTDDAPFELPHPVEGEANPPERLLAADEAIAIGNDPLLQGVVDQQLDLLLPVEAPEATVQRTRNYATVHIDNMYLRTFAGMVESSSINNLEQGGHIDFDLSNIVEDVTFRYNNARDREGVLSNFGNPDYEATYHVHPFRVAHYVEYPSLSDLHVTLNVSYREGKNNTVHVVFAPDAIYAIYNLNDVTTVAKEPIAQQIEAMKPIMDTQDLDMDGFQTLLALCEQINFRILRYTSVSAQIPPVASPFTRDILHNWPDSLPMYLNPVEIQRRRQPQSRS